MSCTPDERRTTEAAAPKVEEGVERGRGANVAGLFVDTEKRKD
mgnify:CR=1 FL=1